MRPRALSWIIIGLGAFLMIMITVNEGLIPSATITYSSCTVEDAFSVYDNNRLCESTPITPSCSSLDTSQTLSSFTWIVDSPNADVYKYATCSLNYWQVWDLRVVSGPMTGSSWAADGQAAFSQIDCRPYATDRYKCDVQFRYVGATCPEVQNLGLEPVLTCTIQATERDPVPIDCGGFNFISETFVECSSDGFGKFKQVWENDCGEQDIRYDTKAWTPCIVESVDCSQITCSTQFVECTRDGYATHRTTCIDACGGTTVELQEVADSFCDVSCNDKYYNFINGGGQRCSAEFCDPISSDNIQCTAESTDYNAIASCSCCSGDIVDSISLNDPGCPDQCGDAICDDVFLGCTATEGLGSFETTCRNNCGTTNTYTSEKITTECVDDEFPESWECTADGQNLIHYKIDGTEDEIRCRYRCIEVSGVGKCEAYDYQINVDVFFGDLYTLALSIIGGAQ